MWYGRFTDLWTTSDEAALQARVGAIRARMDTLRTQGARGQYCHE